jgi:murein DD-endopeptidase MepM/ murein hydrolase activator NlpD
MLRRLPPVVPALVLLLAVPSPPPAQATVVVRHAGRMTARVDDTLAYPGGLFIVDVSSSRGIAGQVVAALDGRRCPAFPSRTGLRVLVPIPSTLPAGSYTLGVEVRGGRGRSRLPLPVEVVGRDYPARSVAIPEPKRALLSEPGAVRDGRQVQLLLRSETPTRYWRAPFRAPVSADPVYSYGAPTLYEGQGAGPVEAVTDAVWGEVHRGMDYVVPAGTVVQAPAAGTVLMAAALPITGQTLMIDHGQGVVSVFFHLGRLDVATGQVVEGRSPVALSGESGIASAPHVHWAVYVHGVAVDPRVMERIVD